MAPALPSRGVPTRVHAAAQHWRGFLLNLGPEVNEMVRVSLVCSCGKRIFVWCTFSLCVIASLDRQTHIRNLTSLQKICSWLLIICIHFSEAVLMPTLTAPPYKTLNTKSAESGRTETGVHIVNIHTNSVYSMRTNQYTYTQSSHEMYQNDVSQSFLKSPGCNKRPAGSPPSSYTKTIGLQPVGLSLTDIDLYISELYRFVEWRPPEK
jgi:hypothetical protein